MRKRISRRFSLSVAYFPQAIGTAGANTLAIMDILIVEYWNNLRVIAKRYIKQDENSNVRITDTAQSYATLLDNLPGAVYRKEYYANDTRITYLSKGYGKLAGFAPDEITSNSEQDRLKKFWHPEDHAKIREFSIKILEGEENLECKVRAKRTDGSYVWLLIREKVVARKAEVTLSEGLLIDIDEEMASKEQLRRHSQRLEKKAAQLRTLIGNLSGIVFRLVYPPDDYKYATLVYGEKKVPKAFLMDGKKLRSLAHPDDVELVYEEVPRRLRDQGDFDYIHRSQLGNGDVIWLHTREKLVGWDGDSMIVEGQSVDITEQMLTKLELEESERRRRRVERRLLEGRRLEGLGRFASGVSHDFNNILGAIISYSGLMKEDLPSDFPAHQNLSKILDAAEQGRSITNQILDYVGKQQIAPQWLDLGVLISDTIALCKNCGCCSTSYVVEQPPIDAWVRVDQVQLGRALLNLFKNASEAVAELDGNVVITMEDVHAQDSHSQTILRHLFDRSSDHLVTDTESGKDQDGTCWAVSGDLKPDQAYVMISISDNGVGMDEKLLDQIFAPFFTTKDHSHGTGLGLSVVHGITLAHNGAIRVQSRLGEGTQFDLIIPRDCG